VLRSLTHYWRINLAVLLGAAVATSVLTGALLVGDSVEGSLKQLTLGRLGKVDVAVLSSRYVREFLAEELRSGEVAKETTLTAPLIALEASIEVAETGARANQVTLYGVDDRFAQFFDSPPLPADRSGDPSGRLRFLYANGPLLCTLGATEGEFMILTLQRPSEIHREFLFGREETEDRVVRRRVRLGARVPDEAGGRFSFEPNQSIPLIAYVRLEALQDLLGLDKKVNRVLVGGAAGTSNEVASTVGSAIRLADYGLRLTERERVVVLESDQFLLSESVGDAARAAADAHTLSATASLTYLANALVTETASVPYSTVTAIGSWSERISPPPFQSISGDPVGFPSGATAYLNHHAGKRLHSNGGDELSLRFFEVESDESFRESTVHLVVGSTVAISGLAADRSLTPDFPGLHDADNMADWDAPFPVDLSSIGEADEAYWDQFGPTPKAFISLEKGQALWSSRFGTLTSVRFDVPSESNASSLTAVLEKEILSGLSPEGQGVRVTALRDDGLEAAKGATDFRGLFFGFSMFLVVSGLVMVSQLFKLGIEDRRSEVGVLKAIGFGTARVRRRLIAEGFILCAAGALIGVAGAVGYAEAMVYGLSTWWVDAVGTSLLDYHGRVSSMVFGWLGAVGLAMAVVWRAVGGTTATSAIGLMRRNALEAADVSKTKALWTWRVFGVLSITLLLVALNAPPSGQVGLFFGVGACVLVAALSLTRSLLQGSGGGVSGFRGLVFAQMARFPSRTMYSITLVALAVFVLVAVGLSRHEEADGSGVPEGAGGFRWVGETVAPVMADLNDQAVLVDAGFTDDELKAMGSRDIQSFRLRPGEDVSCLNLHRPGQPRLLGVREQMVERGGFGFKSTAEGVDQANPWRTLEMDLGEGVIPVIGDFNSVQWILHLGLGQEMTIQDEFGLPVRLRFMALLNGSVLQSEILMSEANFVKHFPSIEGYRFFAMETEQAHDSVSGWMENRLQEYGMDMMTTSFRLARYRAVENTYMATFQMIGGLGALLGTLGVGVMMMRNAVERRGELAAMRAIGFTRSRLRMLLFAETSALILSGIAIGTLAGVLAVAPSLVGRFALASWQSLFLSLAAVAAAGSVSGLVAASLALRAPIVHTLKAEV